MTVFEAIKNMDLDALAKFITSRDVAMFNHSRQILGLPAFTEKEYKAHFECIKKDLMEELGEDRNV